MKKNTIYALISLIFLLGVFYAVVGFSKEPSPTYTPETVTGSPTVNVQNIEEDTVNDTQLVYSQYSAENLEIALEDYESVVLFFHADWCPTCRNLDKEILENFELLQKDQIAIVKVNYDTEKQLKNKYNITLQHTLVLLDKDGNEIKKWVGGDLKNLISKLQI